MIGALTGIWSAVRSLSEPFGTVLTLRFNEFPFVDSSSQNHTLTSVNSTMTSGLYGDAASFPGSNTRIRVETPITFNGDFIMGGWVKFDATSSGRKFFVVMPDGPSWVWWEVDVGGPLGLSLYWGGGYCTSPTPTPIVTDVWYHVLASRVNGVMYMFLNGDLEATSSSLSMANTISSKIWFGGGLDGNGFFDSSASLKGLMDSWQIQLGIGRSTSFTPPAIEV